MKRKLIFLSWSGEQSRLVAKALKDWLPIIIGDHIEPWFSETDIVAGGRSMLELGRILETSGLGILCINDENKLAPWMMFEAGALSKSLDTSAVIPYLIGLDSHDLVGPLQQFQAKKATREGTFEMISQIQKVIGTRVDSMLFQRKFDYLWPQMDKYLRNALRLSASSAVPNGWWIYSLVADTPEGLKDTLGYFYMRYHKGCGVIEDGRALWAFKDPFVHRGNWRSDIVWFDGEVLRFIYAMNSVTPIEGLPTDYDGYLELRRCSQKPVTGDSCWIGSFNDLKHRSSIKGPVYAEHLSLARCTPEALKDRLVKHKDSLLHKAHEYRPGAQI